MTTRVATESYHQYARQWRRQAANVAAKAGLSMEDLAKALSIFNDLRDLETDTVLVRDLLAQHGIQEEELNQ